MRLVVLFVLVLLVMNGSAFAQQFPEGKYVFSAPALFGSEGGTAKGTLVELEATAEGYQLVFLNNPLSRSSRITFTLKDDRIVFETSDMSSSEIGRAVDGKGKVQKSTMASGNLTVRSGSPGFLLAGRKSSEWSLRPATRNEVLESYSEGLEMAEELLWSRRSRQKRSLENAIEALGSVVGYGFGQKDVPILTQMLESGELVYDSGKFSFRDEVPIEAVLDGSSITTNVSMEVIDLRPPSATSNIPMQVFVASIHRSEMVAADPLVEDSVPTPQEKSGTTHRLLPYLVGALVLVAVSIAIMINRRPKVR